jgi:ATP-dependent DNA ligase
MIVFDILVDERGVSWIARSLSERRRKLESFAKAFSRGDDFLLSPATQSLAQARRWLRASGGNLDGIMAKRIDAAYRSGDRKGMKKIKRLRTADCVVGGFRYASTGTRCRLPAARPVQSGGTLESRWIHVGIHEPGAHRSCSPNCGP